MSARLPLSLGTLTVLAVIVAIAVGFPLEGVAFAFVVPCIAVFALATIVGSDELQRGAIRVGVPALALGVVIPGIRTFLRATLGNPGLQLTAFVAAAVLVTGLVLVLAARGLGAAPRPPWRPLSAPRALVVDPDFSSVRPPAPPPQRTGDDLQLFGDAPLPGPTAETTPSPDAPIPEFVVFRRGAP